MSHPFDHEEPPDTQSILFRVVEGLAVVGFVLAVIVWQTDGTLDAAKRFASGFGLGATPEAAPVQTAFGGRPSDIKIINPSAQVAAASPEEPAGTDPVETGSILPVPVADTGRPVAVALAVPEIPAARLPEPQSGWIASCDTGAPIFCTASQSLARSDDPMMETSWTIEKGEGGLVAIWTTPTGVMVSRGMTLTMGDGKPKTVPFDSCGPRSCEVRAKLASDFIGLLKGSPRISTQIVLRGGKTVTFDFARQGLEPALEKLGV